MAFNEKDFEEWLINQLNDKELSKIISNFNEMKDLANFHISNPFISNLEGAIYQLSTQNWAKGVLLLDQLDFVKNQVDIIKGKGKPSQIDLLFRIKGKGSFSIVELKRPYSKKSEKHSTIREAIAEIMGYANGLCSIFPGLSSRSSLLIVMSSEWPKIVSNAISFLASFNGFSIIEIDVECNDSQKYILTIKKPTDTWILQKEGISPEVINCCSIAFSEDIIDPQLLIEITKTQIQNSGLHGFLLLSKNIYSDNKEIILSMYTLNPFLLVKNMLDRVDVSIIEIILGLPPKSEIFTIKSELDEIALEWAENIKLIFLDSTKILNTFNVFLNKPFKDGNFGDYAKKGHAEMSTIWIEFFGFLSDYFMFWIQNENNYELVSTMGFDKTNGWEQFASIYCHPIIKFLALSDIFQISEFRREMVTTFDVFSHGRKWGRISIIAKVGTEDEYDAEFPFFFIGFVRAPFKVPIGKNKETIAESGESFVLNMTEVLSMRGHPILGYIFLLGYLAESIYYRPKNLKIKNTYTVTNIEDIGNKIIELCTDCGFNGLSDEVANLLKSIDSIGTDLTRLPEIEKFVLNFENFLKNQNQLDNFWFHRGGVLGWKSILKTKIKYTINSQSKFSYPVIMALPNGDWGIVDLKNHPIKEDHIKIWEKMNKDEEFMVIDLGEDAGVVRVVPYGEGDSPGKIVDRREFVFSSNDFKKRINCPKKEETNLICTIINQKCPIDCLLDPPEFELFFENCGVDFQIKKEILMEVYSNLG